MEWPHLILVFYPECCLHCGSTCYCVLTISLLWWNLILLGIVCTPFVPTLAPIHVRIHCHCHLFHWTILFWLFELLIHDNRLHFHHTTLMTPPWCLFDSIGFLKILFLLLFFILFPWQFNFITDFKLQLLWQCFSSLHFFHKAYSLKVHMDF